MVGFSKTKGQFSAMRLIGKSFKKAAWLGALFFCEVACIGSYGQVYEVEGTVVGTAYEANGQPRQQPMDNYDFTIEVSKCTWEMTLKLSEESAAYFRKLSAETGREFTFPDYQRFTFDGQDLYCFSDFETAYAAFSAKRQGEGRPIPAANDNRANGSVVAREVPHLTEGDSEIWLAYASGCYFKNRKDKSLEVTWRWGLPEARGCLVNSGSVKRMATWELQRNPPHLPKSVTYYFDEVGSFTNAQFTVLSYTNAEGCTLPTESTLDAYRRDPSGSGPILLVHYDIKTTKINELEKRFVFPPVVPVLTTVSDFRFNGPDAPPGSEIPYFIRDRFLTMREARNSSNYAMYKYDSRDSRRMQLTKKGFGKMRWGIVCVAAFSISIFLIVVIRNTRAKQQAR